MIYKTIDLCAGIGGIRRGFELAGSFKNVLSAEIDPAAAATYKFLFDDDPTNDLTSEEFKQKVADTDYDVLLAGFPCQPFSRIGDQLGFRDKTRGTIFFDIADIISRTNPRAVFLENVENLVSHDKGNTIKTIIQTLEDELDYRVIGVTIDDDGNYVYSRASLVRNTRDFGLPQNRPRAYIMAFSKKKYGRAVKMLNCQLPTSSEKVIYRDVNEILEKDVDDKYYMAEGYLETLKRHRARNHSKGNGFGYCIVNTKNEEHPMANTILATGGSGKERNLIYQPKDGVAGENIPGKKTPLNSEGIRTMTPTEWGRLQGFVGYAFLNADGTDGFGFPSEITDEQKYKQLGNSVSISVIKAMAQFMLKCFSQLEKQQDAVVCALAENNDFFTKKDVMELLDLNSVQAGNLLKRMADENKLICVTNGKRTRYVKYQIGKVLPPFTQVDKVLRQMEKKQIITSEEVQNLLQTSSGTVNVLLSGLAKSGKIQRISRGKYILSEI